MKINKRFPITDFADVKIGEEVLKVKYRYPSAGQARLISSESTGGAAAMAICKYCVEDIANLVDEGGKKIVLEKIDGPYGEELKEESVALLFNNLLALSLALFYNKNQAPSELDKKKLSSSPTPSGEV